MSHTSSGPEHQQVGGRRREWGRTSCLYPGLFKTQHTRTHTHNLHQSKTAPSLLVGKELAEEHPGLFREGFENMCFL